MRNPFSTDSPFFFAPDEGPRTACWRPPVDVYRYDRGWLVKVELAGVAREDVEITLEGRRLVVAGVRRDFTVREGQRAWSMEIAYNRFERAIELPVVLEGVEIAHESRDGMLLIRVELPETTR